MAAGAARRMHAKTGAKVYIRRRDHKPQWFDVWDGLPYILRRPTPGCEIIVSGGGQRDYIEAKTPEKWVWKRYSPHPAAIAFTPAELAFAAPHAGRVMIEPHGKAVGHSNKVYPYLRWLEVVRSMPETQFVQCGAGDLPWIMEPNVKHVVTPSFRHAAAVLAGSRALVSGEGGLMHAAAAVGVQAVVYFGAFISPEVTGYARNANLFAGTGLGCGMRTNCPHCRKAADRISPEEIQTQLRAVLAGGELESTPNLFRVRGK